MLQNEEQFAQIFEGIVMLPWLGRIVLIASICAFATSTIAREEYFTSGAWEGTRIYDDSNGAFLTCSIYAVYERGDSVMFALAPSKFALLIGNEDWQLTEGRVYEVSIWIDHHNLGSYQAEVTDDVSTMITLPYTDYVIERLKHGRVMHVKTAQTTLSYNLTGTIKAIPALERCVAMGRFQGGTRQNPFENFQTSKNNPFDSGTPSYGSGEVSKSDVATLEQMLVSAGLARFNFFPLHERGGLFENVPYLWTDQRIIGGLLSLEKTDVSLPVFSSIMAGNISQSTCKGEFKYGATSDRFPSGDMVQRIFGNCPSTEGNIALALTMYEQDSNVVIIFHFGEARDAPIVSEADSKLFNWIAGKT